MTRVPGAITSLALSAVVLGLGCTFDAKANPAHGCDGCAPGMCVLNYCLQRIDGGGSGSGGNGGVPGTGGDMGSTGSGSGGGGGIVVGPCEPDAICYLGVPESRGKGVCTDGTSKCDAGGVLTCEGQVVPGDEQCNELDDDCDGEVDEELVLGSCMGSGMIKCGSGMLTCRAGKTECVEVEGEPVPETCNGLDDDCDGKVDNDADTPCYPDGAHGCTRMSDGTYECIGMCQSGMRECSGGQLSECKGFVQPVQEVCGAELAQDDDCNGQVDDACPCDGGDKPQPCFPGPGSAGVGRCRSGTQECVDGKLGPCRGAVVRRDETCQNQGTDDDCNFLRDDVPLSGFLCTNLRNLGDCAFGTRQCRAGDLVCVTTEPAAAETICDGFDENCNGQTDETFNLQTDENNCGTCGMKCGAAQLCCAGVCSDLGTKDHCAGCDACPASDSCCAGACVPSNGTQCNGCCGGGEACCNDSCVTLGTDSNCSECGDLCAGNEDCCDGECTLIGDADNCSACNDDCGGGSGCCGGQCTPLGNDTNCSMCGDACEDAEMCCAGDCSTGDCSACDPECTPPQICCNSGCVDPTEQGTCPPTL